MATVLAVGSRATVTAVGFGNATISATATDRGGLSATQAFAVTVSSAANRPPEPVGVLSPLTMRVDDPAVAVEVRGAFRDPDGDRLTYRAASSVPTVVAVAVRGSTVMVTPMGDRHGDGDGDSHRRGRLQRNRDADVHGDGAPRPGRAVSPTIPSCPG